MRGLRSRCSRQSSLSRFWLPSILSQCLSFWDSEIDVEETGNLSVFKSRKFKGRSLTCFPVNGELIPFNYHQDVNSQEQVFLVDRRDWWQLHPTDDTAYPLPVQCRVLELLGHQCPEVPQCVTEFIDRHLRYSRNETGLFLNAEMDKKPERGDSRRGRAQFYIGDEEEELPLEPVYGTEWFNQMTKKLTPILSQISPDDLEKKCWFFYGPKRVSMVIPNRYHKTLAHLNVGDWLQLNFLSDQEFFDPRLLCLMAPGNVLIYPQLSLTCAISDHLRKDFPHVGVAMDAVLKQAFSEIRDSCDEVERDFDVGESCEVVEINLGETSKPITLVGTDENSCRLVARLVADDDNTKLGWLPTAPRVFSLLKLDKMGARQNGSETREMNSMSLLGSSTHTLTAGQKMKSSSLRGCCI
eukprot:Protomagalhaensia_wolfi_Nauph_80__6075@NODE_854_length_1945_cov_225_708290_g642_i0_p1_GENE_NODE_854_length_1945_cov_225_708290_g642_i0NODE_854_length_1945_cov_225_708290_g642_i0_p1_ORF_typecomplete_len411_score80_74_NODE_854_length_1945_cov_225_708290_g642_i01571389